jgi:hypothetical protein
VGHACFREGSFRLILYISESPLYEPLPEGWPSVPEDFDEPRTYGMTLTNEEGYGPHTARQAIDALNGIGARVITVVPRNTAVPSSRRLVPYEQLCELARATGAVVRREDGSLAPLCLPVDYVYAAGSIEFDESMIASLQTSVIDAIREIAPIAPDDIQVEVEDHPRNIRETDVASFILEVEPPGTDGSDDFSFHYRNRMLPHGASVQLVRGTAILEGDAGITQVELERWQIYIVIPAEQREVIII